jgi:hypothetical protein
MPPFATDFRHVLAILADRCTTLPTDSGHVRPVTADGFAAFATDTRHVKPVSADGLPSFTPSFASLLRRELVSATLDVGSFSPLACDCSLPLRSHRGETAPRTFRHDAS